MKADLRRRLVAQRAALAPEERRRQSRAIVERLRHLPLLQSAHHVAGYHPTAVEVDALEFLSFLHERRRHVYLPRVDGHALAFHEWSPGDELVRGPHRILEPAAHTPTCPPESIDAVLVPGVAYDRRGHRLGSGRGFYDRLLGQVAMERRVGLAFDEQLVDELPTDPHDVPVGWIITPTATFHLKT